MINKIAASFLLIGYSFRDFAATKDVHLCMYARNVFYVTLNTKVVESGKLMEYSKTTWKIPQVGRLVGNRCYMIRIRSTPERLNHSKALMEQSSPLHE